MSLEPNRNFPTKKEFLKTLPGSLEKRIYRFKSASNNFYCPLCRTPRAIMVQPRPSFKNHLQILLTTSVMVLLFYPIMEWRALVFFFIIWGGLEAFQRLLFKKDVPCPHCGFDASWYKKDVREAKRRVQEFWVTKNAEKNTAATNASTQEKFNN